MQHGRQNPAGDCDSFENSLRDTEFVGRYGGEEFVLLLPDVAPADIAQLLNRVREKVKIFHLNLKIRRITSQYLYCALWEGAHT